MPNEKLYSVGEFAKLIGKSQSFVRSCCERGIITYYRPAYKRLIPAKAVDELKVIRNPPQKTPKPKFINKHRGSDLRVIPTYKRA